MADTHALAFGAAAAEAVSKLLTPNQIELLKHLALPGKTRSLNPEQFLNHLFARAPQELLKGSAPEDAARVLSGCLAVLDAVDTKPDTIAITIGQGLQGPALYLALRDCPFIISSIAERLAEAHVTVEAFQHPIVVLKHTTIALSYIEISSPEDSNLLLPLVNTLKETLSSLQIIVADFDPMRSIIADKSTLQQNAPLRSPHGDLEVAEVREFLSWLSDGCFFLLGTARWSDAEGFAYRDGLGAFRVPGAYREALVTEVREDIQRLRNDSSDLSIRKLRINSPIHRPATVLNVVIRLGDSPGTLLSISGYLTSKAWSYEAEDIPILRTKVAALIVKEGTVPNSFDYKYRIEVIDNMPTDEALSMSVEEIASIAQLALGLFSSHSSRTKIFVDPLRRRALTVIILSPERYSAGIRDTIQSTLESTFRAPSKSSDFHLDSTKRRQLRLYFSTPLPRDFTGPVPEALLAQTFTQASLTWEEKLAEILPDRDDASQIRGIFPHEYQAGSDVYEAASDLSIIESLSSAAPTAVALFAQASSHKPPVLSIFSLSTTISISQATPVLENIGLEVLSAHSYTCSYNNKTVFLLKLAVRPYDGEALQPERFNRSVAPGLTDVLAGRAQNDPLNLLLRRAPLTVREIGVLRAYCALLWQVQKISTKRTMWEALAGTPAVAYKLFTIFSTLFDPALQISREERKHRVDALCSEVLEALRQVPDITQDRVLRALFSLVKNTVRTNFYNDGDTFAFKITPQKIEIMPHPRPLFEIFVFSPRIEGTHLRSARVARGGIRWSERTDDFRAEVLGLMKTQKVKNVIIVPSGAKGGFIMKSAPSEAEQLPAAVERSYREYITALLSIADNDTGSGIAHPQGCIVHDEPDPYFVVAADKGTATFSDVANSIATKDFSFWLEDAFASGGSQGYDHKKYGITARGGWECVLRHFKDLGIDYEHTPFTTVGIGDMSGDVFGNALLLSRQASLIAAFNHKHIFIDPTPNNDAAFKERERLFTTPRTQWSDYRRELISAGGGVFNRFDKEIVLTPEIRTALSIPEDVPEAVDGETLIALILKARVDLLWNGGIGTYVKARVESHSDVNDGTNDRVRINADELRARVVGEGGNLGFTQRARIEFSNLGGRINTDAIDNSGGVDLSDHEVNLKLLLNPLVRTGKLDIEKRNALLKEIASDVVSSVLEHNRSQSLMLTVGHQRSAFLMEQYRAFIREMNRLGYLDRTRDYLPDDEEIDERIVQKTGLARPELAICSAAVKMYMKEELVRSELCKDPHLTQTLLNYFPPKVQEQFRDPILHHPLSVEIIASELANELVPIVDIPFIFSATHTSGHSVPQVVASIIAADEILGLRSIRSRLRQFDTPQNASTFIEVWRHCNNALREASSWLINVHGADHSLKHLIDLYQGGFDQIVALGGLSGTSSDVSYPLDFSPEESVRLRLYKHVVPILEVLWITHEYKGDIRTISEIFAATLSATGLQFLFAMEPSLTPSNRWEQELIRGAYEEIRRSLSTITGQLFLKGRVTPSDVEATLSSTHGFAAIRSLIQEIQQRVNSKRSFEVAVLPVVARHLRLLGL